MSALVAVPAGFCPWCKQWVRAEHLPATRIEGGFRVDASHRWASEMTPTDGDGLGCHRRVRMFITTDGNAPDGWERDRSVA